MPYSANVEKWRPIVEKYFKPEDVDKALYVISGESGGNPLASGDGGSSIGLFQMNMSGGLGTGSTAEQLQDPEYNIKLAAQAVYGGSGWGPWGEGRLYEGKPFGALGNNPYPGSTNARTPVGGAISQIQSQTEPVTDNRKLIKGLPRVQDFGKTVPKQPDRTYGYVPTGDFDADTSAYWEAAQKAYSELADYQLNSPSIITVDEDEGVVYVYDPESESLVVDEIGSKILGRALTNMQSLDRLYAAKNAGLIKTGEGSAAAFVAAEKEKKADAADDYEGYVKRISDLAAVEDIPTARLANFASTMQAVNKAAKATGATYSGGMGSSGRPQLTDFSPFAESMKNAIPKQAPAPYDIPPEIFDMTKINPNRIPARDPNQILQEAGLGGFTPMPAQTGTTPQLTTLPGQVGAPPLTTLNNQVQKPYQTPTVPNLANIIQGTRYIR